ncbi:MAG: hypothetical protein SOW80_04155 [Anaerovoracaceae bacterium]|nr:hypothetical protein [Anaerovoracaceae bacterium]
MYRIHQIKLAFDEPQEKIPEKILKKIGGRDFFIKEWEIVKESIDARDKNHIVRVYSVDFNVASRKNPKKNLRLPSAGKLRLEIAPDMRYVPAEPAEGAAPRAARPVVVGLGPAGLFCALILAQAGYRPLILERGKDVDRRHEDVDRFWSHGVLNPDSNVQFGEGGAGTFSDGKLTTGIKDVRIRKVLEEMVAAGAPKDILYKQRPHIGTDLLRIVVKNIRQEIIRLGGEVRFDSRMETINLESGGIRSISVRNLQNGGHQKENLTEIPCQALVLAVGHSARDTFRMLHESGIAMEQKPFSIGVRIEHPQDLIDISQYGRPGRQLGLPPAEYKINYRCASGGQGPAAGRGVYTFCMCPGGQVIVASSREGGVVTNGMSYHDRDSGIANSALLCDVRTDDFGSSDVLAGVAFQEKYEHLAFEAGRRQNPDGKPYSPPQTTWGRLRDGLAPEVEACLPAFAVAAFREAMPQLGRKLHGFDAEDAVMTAVETRSSSPVRILRGETYESAAGGLYPCGEGAGYAGGITSAAVDGIRVAEAIIKAYTPALG